MFSYTFVQTSPLILKVLSCLCPYAWPRRALSFPTRIQTAVLCCFPGENKPADVWPWQMLRPETSLLLQRTGLFSQTRTRVCPEASNRFVVFNGACECSVWWPLQDTTQSDSQTQNSHSARRLYFSQYEQYNVMKMKCFHEAVIVSGGKQLRTFTILTILCDTFYFYSTIFWRQILYFLLHYIYFSYYLLCRFRLLTQNTNHLID